MKFIEIRFSINHWLQFKVTSQEIERILKAYENQEIYCIFDSENTQDKHYINMKQVLEIVVLK